MSQTLSTTTTLGITLSVNGMNTSPFTITPSGSISTTGSYSVYSAIPAPTLLNEGYVAAAGGVGIKFDQNGTVLNDGTITIPQNNFYAGIGVSLSSGGYVNNSGTASVITGGYAVRAQVQTTITNSGTITGLGMTNAGIMLNNAGSATRISNNADGVITGRFGALYVRGTANIYNQGVISTYTFENQSLSSRPAIFLDAGTIYNAANGTITGVQLGAGNIIDAGLIADTLAAGYAISLGPNANVILQPSAQVVGGIYGFIANQTIDEVGVTITSENAALVTTPDGLVGSVLTLYNQSSVVGALTFAGALNTSAFLLAPDGNGGTDVALGTETFTGSYTNTSSRRGADIASVHLEALTNIIAVNASINNSRNHRYALFGSMYRDWSLTNSGTIAGGAWFADSALVSNAASGLIAGGNLGIRIKAGTVVNSGTITGAEAAIALSRGSSVDVVLNPGSTLKGGIYGFVSGDTIELAGVTATSETFSGGVLTLSNAGAQVATVALDGIFDSTGFQLESLANGTGIVISSAETITGTFIAPPNSFFL